MNKKRITLLIFISLFIIGLLWLGISIPKNPWAKKGIVFSVEKGQNLKEISTNLEKQGIIRSRLFFIFYATAIKESKNLKAGEYSLSRRMNIPQIVDIFVSGTTAKKEITIQEGWNLKKIADLLKKEGLFSEKEFLAAVNSSKFNREFSFLEDKPANSSLEGYLFPDTYEILLGEKSDETIRRMLANFDEKLTADFKKEILRQKKSIFEIITMASLIEKEVRTLEDKKIISGILWKRMKIGMPLQVDATIAYITGKNTTRISIAETKIDSPYNTYKYKGLPQGPISNPGQESIMAAIYPKNSDYLYYLSAPAGQTIFSKTLEEHNAAKAKYLR